MSLHDGTQAGPSTPLRSAENPVAERINGTSPIRKRDARPWLLLVSLLVFVLDRLTKRLVVAKVALGDAISVVPGVFRITHVRNTGAAFSMFAETASPGVVRWGLIAFSLFAGAIVAGMLWRSGRRFSAASFGFALILGGATGNLLDRIRLHYVTDFLEVHIVRYHWPDFNLADSAISVGACLLLLDVLFVKRDEHGS